MDDNLKSHGLGENIFKMAETERQLRYRLLLQVGGLRAQLFQECLKSNCKPLLQISDELVADLIREVQILPYRAYALISTKIKDARDQINSGLKGWVELTRQLFGILTLIALPFIFFFFAQSLSRRLENFRSQILHRSQWSYSQRTSISLLILRLNPYLKWGLMYAFIEVAESIMDRSEIAELIFFVGLLKIYFLYRISLILLNSILTYLFQREGLESYSLKKEKINSSARRISLILFGEILSLYVVSEVLRKALMYTLISSGILYFNILFFLFEARRWKEEIWSLSDGALPESIMNFSHRYENGIFSLLLTPLLGILSSAVIVFEISLTWLSQFDFFKRIHSEIFKKRLEDVSKKSEKEFTKEIPEEYKSYFSLDDTFPTEALVKRKQEDAKKIVEHIYGWRDERIEEDGYVVTGAKGIGKSTTLREAFEQLDVEKKFLIRVPPKITSTKDFFSFLSKQLNAPLTSIEDLVQLHDTMESHHVLFFDNAQNFFLGTPEGFEAYKTLLECVNLPTTKLFWLFSFDRRSWDHLQGIFGKDHIFGKTLEIKSWNDVEIQNLIIQRHNLTGFELRFDRLISAFQSSQDQGGQVETQFFRLLWGQSRGNPRIALALWLSALTDLGRKRIFVGVPEFNRVKGLSDASDDSLFVYAAIVRHENISILELHNVTHLSEAIVKRALRYGEDYGILQVKDRRVQVRPLAQHSLNNYLLGKNFIYE